MLLRRKSSSPRGFSPPRIALFVTLLAILAAMLILRALDVAGFNGTVPEEMDWNGDGQVTWPEIMQGFYAVGVRQTREAQRICRHYAFLRTPQAVIRVDCRMEMEAAP